MFLLSIFKDSPSTVIFCFSVFLLINVISFSAFFADKQKAVKGTWRIPEKTLIFLSVIGGAAGALLAMKLFRHKTRHPCFSIGIPLLLILQIIIAMIFIFLFF